MDQETKLYLEEQMMVEVFSGYGDESTVREDFEQLLRDEASDLSSDELTLWLGRLDKALSAQRQREQTWERPTANDRITAAFSELGQKGIVALEDAGYTLSDGWTDIEEARFPKAWGGVFFHRQDVERGIVGNGLLLAFGAFDEEDHEALSRKLGKKVCDTLARHKVATEWDGSVDSRIQICPFPWQRRRF